MSRQPDYEPFEDRFRRHWRRLTPGLRASIKDAARDPSAHKIAIARARLIRIEYEKTHTFAEMLLRNLQLPAIQRLIEEAFK